MAHTRSGNERAWSRWMRRPAVAALLRGYENDVRFALASRLAFAAATVIVIIGFGGGHHYWTPLRFCGFALVALAVALELLGVAKVRRQRRRGS